MDSQAHNRLSVAQWKSIGARSLKAWAVRFLLGTRLSPSLCQAQNFTIFLIPFVHLMQYSGHLSHMNLITTYLTIESLWLSGRAWQHKIHTCRSEVGLLMSTPDFFIVPCCCMLSSITSLVPVVSCFLAGCRWRMVGRNPKWQSWMVS